MCFGPSSVLSLPWDVASHAVDPVGGGTGAEELAHGTPMQALAGPLP